MSVCDWEPVRVIKSSVLGTGYWQWVLGSGVCGLHGLDRVGLSQWSFYFYSTFWMLHHRYLFFCLHLLSQILLADSSCYQKPWFGGLFQSLKPKLFYQLPVAKKKKNKNWWALPIDNLFSSFLITRVNGTIKDLKMSNFCDTVVLFSYDNWSKVSGNSETLSFFNEHLPAAGNWSD